MKKRFKQLLAAVLAMTMLLMTALPVSAATTKTKKNTLTYIRTSDGLLFWWYYMQDNLSPHALSGKEHLLPHVLKITF